MQSAPVAAVCFSPNGRSTSQTGHVQAAMCLQTARTGASRRYRPMTSQPPDIVPTSSLEMLLSQVGSLSDEAFNSLKSDIESEFAFDTDAERCERLARVLDVSPETTALLLSAISFLVDRVSSLAPNVLSQEIFDQFVDQFDEVELNVNSKRLLANRLKELTAPNPKIESWAKICRLRAGFSILRRGSLPLLIFDQTLRPATAQSVALYQ